MYMLHRWEGKDFLPVTESSIIAEILTSRPWAGLESVRLRMGKWNRTFLDAEETWERISRGELPASEADRLLPELLRMAISRDDRLVGMTRRYFTLPDVLKNLETDDRHGAGGRKIGRHAACPGNFKAGPIRVGKICWNRTIRFS